MVILLDTIYCEKTYTIRIFINKRKEKKKKKRKKIREIRENKIKYE